MNTPIRNWVGRRVWIIGASSGIGAALARELLAKGAHVALSARSRGKLESLAAGGGTAMVLPFDVTEPDAFTLTQEKIIAAWGGIDLAAFVAGTYVPVRAWELTAAQARATVETNLLSVMNAVGALVPRFLEQKGGAIAIVGSVAGYRGLPKSLLYGATKSALINFAETLYLDLEPKGISVFLVSPGFVETPLTAQNDFKMPALISPEEAAREMIDGFARGRFEIHFPKRFTRAMKFLEHLPYALYFRVVRRFTGL